MLLLGGFMKTLLVFLGFFPFVVANQAVACSYSEPTVKELFKYSDLVFVGKVTKIQQMGSNEDYVPPSIIATFAVSGYWKGLIGKSFTLYTTERVHPCDGKSSKRARAISYTPRSIRPRSGLRASAQQHLSNRDYQKRMITFLNLEAEETISPTLVKISKRSVSPKVQ